MPTDTRRLELTPQERATLAAFTLADVHHNLESAKYHLRAAARTCADLRQAELLALLRDELAPAFARLDDTLRELMDRARGRPA